MEEHPRHQLSDDEEKHDIQPKQTPEVPIWRIDDNAIAKQDGCASQEG